MENGKKMYVTAEEAAEVFVYQRVMPTRLSGD